MYAPMTATMQMIVSSGAPTGMPWPMMPPTAASANNA
jgi:hypothetical protein